ncbi:hypothetical protein ACOBR2_05175 [Telmatobacter bradus]|uniref:hypothetical protein n=1 Tax=Telmatobacter bradus TaxID=474953 RepID=UPI003B4382B6
MASREHRFPQMDSLPALGQGLDEVRWILCLAKKRERSWSKNLPRAELKIFFAPGLSRIPAGSASLNTCKYQSCTSKFWPEKEN